MPGAELRGRRGGEGRAELTDRGAGAAHRGCTGKEERLSGWAGFTPADFRPVPSRTGAHRVPHMTHAWGKERNEGSGTQEARLPRPFPIFPGVGNLWQEHVYALWGRVGGGGVH